VQAAIGKSVEAPQTTKIYKNKTRRCDFKRRPLMSMKSIIIVNFEGVLGEFMNSSESLTSDEFSISLYFRPGKKLL
jgi:hypothetical protein